MVSRASRGEISSERGECRECAGGTNRIWYIRRLRSTYSANWIVSPGSPESVVVVVKAASVLLPFLPNLMRVPRRVRVTYRP